MLLVGPPGVGKTMFCEHLLIESLKNHTSVLYVTLDRPPSQTRERIHEKGISLQEGKSSLTIVDGYSWLIGGSEERYRVSNLSNLSDLSVKTISALDDLSSHSLFIFDSISTLLIYNSENEVARFLEINMARMKHNNQVSLWAIELGIHSAQFYNTLRHMADCTLEMRFEEQGELLRYIRMHTFKGLRHNTMWHKFEIDQTGDVVVIRDKA
ncbi:MAG: hypothetical protein JSV76_07965 [Candidatus Bathyarchaeota archaeon]|nr:MAG: hypothetical protein JSV76_07965 [Candidatus Bathyarchaeota archaeon]